MRRCGERMVSKAARQEPTPRGYHTGMHDAERESLDQEMCLIEKDAMLESSTIDSPSKKCGLTTQKKAAEYGRYRGGGYGGSTPQIKNPSSLHFSLRVQS